MQQSICVISEDLSSPLDEGIKRFTHSLIQSWSREYRVMGLSVNSKGQVETPNTISVRTNRLFLSYSLLAKIRRFRPHFLFYVPSPSATFFSFLRSRLLKLYWSRGRVIMVSLQPRKYGWLSRRLVHFLSPDMVLVQNEQTMKQLSMLGCRTQLIPSGVDLEKFKPALPEKKEELRARYGLNTKAFTVLHVGHITRARNIELLTRVRREYAAQVVLVGSSLPHKDRTTVIIQLRRQGIIVIDSYLHNIEELYQLSDCYLFPVFSDQASIGTPLSVLEAMACNLPVITVRYGSLPILFKEGQGLLFADTPDELVHSIALAQGLNGCHTREKVLPYSWHDIAKNLLVLSGANKEER